MKPPSGGAQIALIIVSLLLMNWFIGSFLMDAVLSDESVNDDYIMAEKMIRAINNDDSEKILIFGSSMAREGIDQREIEKRLGWVKVYNLSISSGKPSDFYLMLSKIRSKEKIKLAVFAFSPWMIQKKYTDDVVSGKDPFTNLMFDSVALAAIMPASILRSGWFAKSALTSLIPFHRHVKYFRNIFDQNDLSFWKKPDERVKAEAWRQYNYWENKPESYFAEELGKESNHAEYSVGNCYWDGNENIQIRAWRKTISGLADRKIPVLAIDMPVNPYKKFLYEDGLAGRFQAIFGSVPDGARFSDMSSVYPKENFIDFNHLNAGGRERFSNDLLAVFKKDYGF